jgi:hypothetical protein
MHPQPYVKTFARAHKWGYIVCGPHGAYLHTSPPEYANEKTSREQGRKYIEAARKRGEL